MYKIIRDPGVSLVFSVIYIALSRSYKIFSVMYGEVHRSQI